MMGSDFWFLLDAKARHIYDHVSPPIVEYAHIGLTARNGTWANQTIFGTIAVANTTIVPINIVKGCYRAPDWPWWRQPLPWWAMTFLVPTYLIFSSLHNLHNLRKVKELIAMVVFACISYAVNVVANKYVTRVTFSTTAGALTIALLGNAYSRLFQGSAFTSMVTGVTFLVPSGIANAGGLSQTYVSDVAQYQTGFVLAIHMLQVAVGVTVGLSLGQFIVYIFGRKKTGARFTF